jgi:hypothetical protein
MPTYFPPLNSRGMLVQRPYQTSHSYSTIREDMPMGRRYAFEQFGNGLARFPSEPLARFDLQYSSLTDDELAALEAFFDAMAGRFGPFTFLDPNGNLVAASENFSDASWQSYSASPGSSASDPWGGARGTSVSSSGSNSMLATAVLPDGGAAGFVLCGSVWVLAPAAQQLAIGFIDSSFTLLHSTTWNLPANSWTRIFDTHQLATASYIRLLIGGLGTWSGQTLRLFGAQCVPTLGPGAYAKTPGNYGLHPNCRFDTDALAINYQARNRTAVRAPIAEYFVNS